MTRGRALPIALAVGFLALRVATILTAPDRIFHPEQLERGTLAKELVEGLKAPLWGHQSVDHAGAIGPPVVSFMAAPLFALLGPRLVVLKLVPLAFTFATLVLLLHFLGRRFGRDAAVAGALLFALSPPAVAQLSLMAQGFHAEAAPFVLLLLILLYRVLDERRPRARLIVLLGVVAGLAFSFAYITALATLASVIVWVVRRPRSVWPRGILLVSLGLVIGLLPCLLSVTAYQVHGLATLRAGLGLFDVVARAPGSPAAAVWTFGSRLVSLIALWIPRSLAFQPVWFLPGLVVSYVYFGLAVLATVWALRDGDRRRRLMPLVVSLAVLVVAYAASNASYVSTDPEFLESRYFMPLYAVGFPLVAAGVAALPRPWLLLAPLLVVGAIGQSSLVGITTPAAAVAHRGYSYRALGVLWQRWLYPESETFREVSGPLSRFREPERRAVFRGLLDATRERPLPADAERLRTLLAEVPPAERRYFLEVLGARVANGGGQDVDRLIERLALAPTDGRTEFLAGFALVAADALGERIDDYRRLADAVGPYHREWFDVSLGRVRAVPLVEACTGHWRSARCDAAMRSAEALARASPAVARGLGRTAFGYWADWGDFPRALAVTMDVARRLAPALRDEFFHGVGWQACEQIIEDRGWAVELIERLPRDARGSAARGLAACEAWLGVTWPR